MSAESAYVRGLVVEAVEAAAELMSRPVVGEKWDEPSALDGMTVGSLSAHLVRPLGRHSRIWIGPIRRPGPMTSC